MNFCERFVIKESYSRYKSCTYKGNNVPEGTQVHCERFSRVYNLMVHAQYLGIYHHQVKILKPIFHQNAKYLASGTFASPNAKDSIFASPNPRNNNMLVCLALGDASFLRWPCTFLFFCVDFFALGSKRNLYSSGI